MQDIKIEKPKWRSMEEHVGIMLFGVDIIYAGWLIKYPYEFGIWAAILMLFIAGMALSFWTMGVTGKIKSQFKCPELTVKIYNDYATWPNIDDGLTLYFKENGFCEIEEHKNFYEAKEQAILKFVDGQNAWFKSEYKSEYYKYFSTRNAFKFQFIEKMDDGNGCLIDSVVATYTCDYETLNEKYNKVRRANHGE